MIEAVLMGILRAAVGAVCALLALVGATSLASGSAAAGLVLLAAAIALLRWIVVWPGWVPRR